MKNKFVKFLSTGICCIMVSLLISASMPQKYTGALNSNSIHKIGVIILSDEPPFL